MMKQLLILGVLLSMASMANASGPYEGLVDSIQLNREGPFTSVFLQFDINDSPCAESNDLNRLILLNEAQVNLVIAAIAFDKAIQVFSLGQCISGIDQVDDIQIFQD